MRLTWRRADGEVCPRVAKGADIHYIAGEFTQKVYDKLAAYEDTGYSPLEIKSLEGEWNAMRKVVDSYRKAEEQGRLVILPCKVGQEVFTVEDAAIYCTVDGVEEIDHILEFEICDCGLTFSTEWYEARPIGEIGKTVFLTREEAETALNGGQGNA